jgi:hypothetical protein
VAPLGRVRDAAGAGCSGSRSPTALSPDVVGPRPASGLAVHDGRCRPIARPGRSLAAPARAFARSRSPPKGNGIEGSGELRLPGLHRCRATRHGGVAQPGDRHAQPGGAGQPRCRPAPPRPQPSPAPRHPGDQPRTKPTSRQNGGAVALPGTTMHLRRTPDCVDCGDIARSRPPNNVRPRQRHPRQACWAVDRAARRPGSHQGPRTGSQPRALRGHSSTTPEFSFSTESATVSAHARPLAHRVTSRVTISGWRCATNVEGGSM